ncbi:hypothetical protein BDC45DRAFT_444880, partial [Circinella umbellata]
WSETVSSIVRNLWYRVSHKTILCKQTLHHIIPLIHHSPCCIFCPSVVDTPIHFLYSCPYKWNIWLSVWNDLFLSTSSVSNIHQAIFSLKFPPNPSSYSSHVIIACILHGIWSAHWRFLFDQVPFNSEYICSNMHFLISKSMISPYEPP